MVVDTSALLAILLDEPEALFCSEAIEAAPSALISAATRVELDIVILNKLGEEALGDADDLLETAGIQIEPVTAAQTGLARQAYLRFGKGRGHPAQLNYGDCFSYALAKDMQEPLLFVGKDFAATDIAPVSPPEE